MIENFFLAGEIPVSAAQGVYSPGLMLLSYIIAFFGSYTGLSLASDMRRAKTIAQKNALHYGGAFALGAGIWSMHFIGMLAYNMEMAYSYDPFLTFLSMAIAISVAYFALWSTRAAKFKILPVVVGAVLLGFAICAMHYVGMAAMKMDANLRYIPWLFYASVAVAITASSAALSIIFFLGRHEGKFKEILTIIAALIMGLAICGMHYTGMAAAVFLPYADCRYDPNQDFGELIFSVTGITGLIFCLYIFQKARRLFLILLCSTLFTLPLVMIVYQGISILNSQILFAQKEKDGIRYHEELVDLFRRLQELRGVSYRIQKGDETAREEIEPLRAEVRRSIESTEKAGALTVILIGAEQQWKDVKEGIISLLDRSSFSAADGFERYTNPLESILELMNTVSNKSNLTLDPQLDSDYLADAMVVITPELMATLGKIRGLTSGLLASAPPQEWSYEERENLEKLYYQFQFFNDDMINGLQEAGNANKKSAQFVAYYTTMVSPKLKEFEESFEKIVFGKATEISSSEFFRQATQCINAYDVLYDLVAERFFELLSERQNAYIFKKNLVLYSSLTALLGFIGLFIFLYRNLILTERAKKEMKDQRTLLDTLLNNMPLAIFAKDVKKNYQWVMINKMAEKIFGLREKDVIGHVDHDFFPREEADFFRATDEKVMAEGKLVDIGAEPVTTPNGTFTAHTLKVPIYDGRGNPSILLGILEDVTEKMEFLEQLRIAKDQAESANVAKSDFLANMSHELRTPLNSILGMNRLLLETELKPEQHDLADAVFRSSVDLLTLVNDILDLSKIESGEMELEHIGFDITYSFYAVIHALSHIASEKHLSIIKSYDREAFPYVMGDPLRVTRILTNLIGNAIKYTDKGHVEFRASCKNLDKNHVEIHCEIEDTGIGIPEDKLEKIFEKFGQADTSTTRKYGGTGLGLAITKQLVEMMGGAIGVQSKPGAGSVFWVTIPFEMTEELSPGSRSEQRREATGSIPAAEARILLAEDHPANQILARKVMQKFGIGHFEIMNNGLEALNRYKEESWDVILMDCHMPEMSGYDATLEIRRLDKAAGKHTPIVAMTANAMVGEKEKCLRHGMDDYMSKPINIDELKDILSQWLKFNGHESPAKKDLAPDKDGPVDLSQLRTFTGDDKDAEREFIMALITQSDQNMEVLENNSFSESTAWTESAHMMKGGAGGIGAFELQRLCAEAQAFQGPDEERRALFEKIKNAYRRVKDHLTAMDLL